MRKRFKDFEPGAVMLVPPSLAEWLPAGHLARLRMDGRRGCSTAMLSIPSICLQISAALGRPVDYEQALELAEEGNRAAVAGLEAAAKSLGVLIAAAANLSMVNMVVLGGEALALFTARKVTALAALAAGRGPEAEPVTVRVASADFTEWARGAAAVAIQAQAFVL